MATSPFTVDPHVQPSLPENCVETKGFSREMQELARFDRSKTMAHDAVRLWLRWNAIHEKLSAAMFNKRHDQCEIERMMDESDSLRRQAIQLSCECLLEQ